MTRLLPFAVLVLIGAACGSTGSGFGAGTGPAAGAACSAAATATCGYAGANPAVLVCTSGFWSAKALCAAGSMCLVGAVGPECAGTAVADAITNPDGGDAGADTAGSPEVVDATGSDAAYNDGIAKACQKPADCNDKDPCTADECNAATLTCNHVALVLCGKPLTACATSKDCGAGTVCDPSMQACVGCLSNADCGVGNRCLQSQCVPSVACQSDMQCKSSGGICDVKTGVCVPCVKDSQCGPGQECKGQSCVTKQPCVSSKDCQGVCNEGLGLCVGCNLDLDCNAGYFCATNAECKPVVCAKPNTFCAGGKLWACNYNGSAYYEKDKCDDGNPCTTDGCATSACTHAPGPVGASCGGGGTCTAGGLCEVKVCDPQTPSYCKGNTAMKCDYTGTNPTVVQTCIAPQTCSNGTCKPPQSGLGCVGAADVAYIEELGKDAAKAEAFTNDTKSCTLGSCISKTTDAEGSACVGNCLVKTKGHKLTTTCATCYGIRPFCTLNNCIKNPAESISGCATNSGGQPCLDCQSKYNCIQAGEDCKAGK